jgi:hypothetical protein
VVFYEIFFRILPFTNVPHLLITTKSALPSDYTEKDRESFEQQGYEIDLKNKLIIKSEFNTMIAKKEICELGLRPKIPDDFSSGFLLQLLNACWHKIPNNRPTCETLEKLLVANQIDTELANKLLTTGIYHSCTCECFHFSFYVIFFNLFNFNFNSSNEKSSYWYTSWICRIKTICWTYCNT